MSRDGGTEENRRHGGTITANRMFERLVDDEGQKLIKEDLGRAPPNWRL